MPKSLLVASALLAAPACRVGGPAPRLAAAAEAAHVTPAAVAGCYAASLQWNEQARARPGSLAALQPPRLRLGTAPAYPGGSPPGYRVEAASGDTIPRAFEIRSWQVEDGGTVRLVWSTGFLGIDLRLRPASGGLAGTIRHWADDDPEGFTAGDAILRRIPCDDPAERGGP